MVASKYMKEVKFCLKPEVVTNHKASRIGSRDLLGVLVVICIVLIMKTVAGKTAGGQTCRAD